MNSLTNSLSHKSEKTLTVFVNSDFGKVRTLYENDEPYFVGKDVAEILGYSNPNEAIHDHVDEEDKLNSKMLLSNDLDLGQRGGWIINESGLYSLILSSKLPGAKQFKRWVTSEVLPALRKNGSYSVPKTFAEALRLAAEQQEKIALMQPKVDVYDRICDSESLKSVETVASNLGYGKNNFFALMRGMGIFYYSTKDADGKRFNLPKQEYKDRGYFVTKEEPYTRGDKDCLYTKIYVTGKGETWLAAKVNEGIEDAADKIIDGKTYTLNQVNKIAKIDLPIIKRFLIVKKYTDSDNQVTEKGFELGYFIEKGNEILMSEKGKEMILKAFGRSFEGLEEVAESYAKKGSAEYERILAEITDKWLKKHSVSCRSE